MTSPAYWLAPSSPARRVDLPIGPTVISLRAGRGCRRVSVLIIVLGLLMAGIPLFAMLVGAFAIDMSLWARLVVGTISAAGLTLVVVLLRHRGRAAWSRGTLTIDRDHVRIDYPALLREPWRVPASTLHAAMVDEGRRKGGRYRRFPLCDPTGEDPSSPIAWFWNGEFDVDLPGLFVDSQAPTVLLLFDRSLHAPRTRLRTSRGPFPDEALAALMLCAEAPQAAHEALAERGVIRPLAFGDAGRTISVFRGDRVVGG